MMNHSHGNVTEDDTEPQLSMIHKVVFVGLWALGLLLNIGCAPIVGWVMWKRPTWPTILLFILTLTDAMVVVFGVSVSIVSVAKSSVMWEMSPLCTYQSVVINTWYLYSYIVVLAISMDRYLAVCHPFVYNKQLSNKAFVVKGTVTLVLAGVAMLVVATLPLMIGANIVPVKPGLFCFFDWTSGTTQNRLVAIINVSITSLTVGLLLFFTTATCFGIYQIVQSSHSRDGNMSLSLKVSTQSDNEMEVKFAKLMIVVIILFATCNLPFVVVVFVQMITEYHSPDVGYLALAGLLFGTQINPIVHAMVQRSVRKYCYDLLRIVCSGHCCLSCLYASDF